MDTGVQRCDERNEHMQGDAQWLCATEMEAFIRTGEYQRCPENGLDGRTHAQPSSQTTVVQRLKLCEAA